VLGVRLTFDKRYITLAPIATIVGLAFRMHDPDKLLGGDEEDRGITLR
jgi:acyl-CoA dehydrogenase